MHHTLSTLETILSTAKRPVLWVSGGKDSLTVLHLCRPWRHRVVVLHLHEPEGWPGVTENLFQCLDAWGFLRNVTCAPSMSLETYVGRFGWPVDLVPSMYDGVSTTPLSPFWDGTVTLASWWHCSIVRHLQPLQWATAALQADVVLTGSRASDAPAFARMGAHLAPAEGGVAWTRVDPIHAWTAAQVYAYLAAEQIPLPPHYQWKQHHPTWEWHDCLSCTWQPEHWQILRAHYPEEFARRWPQVAPVFAAIQAQIETYGTRVKELTHGTRGRRTRHSRRRDRPAAGTGAPGGS